MRSGSRDERGNIFAFLFGAVAVVGVITATAMQLLTGPIKTATRVNNKNAAEAQMMAAGRILIIDAATQTNDGDVDSDGTVEPRAFTTVAAGGITGGGSIPLTVGATRSDPWGTLYGYCVWNNGTSNGALTNILAGALTTTSPVPTVIAIVSAGPDKLFQTSCAAYASGNTTGDGTTRGVIKVSGSDDLVMKWSYAEAIAASAGLWAIKTGSPNTATIGKNLEVTDPGNANAVTASINRQTGIGDFLGVKTDVLTPKTADNIALNNGYLKVGTASATQGTILLSSQYSAGNLNTIGTMYSSGNTVLTYGVKPSAVGNDYLSSVYIAGNPFSRSALEIGTYGLLLYTAPYSSTMVGTSIAMTPRLIVTNAGDVGIGTTTPQALLDIGGRAGAVANKVVFNPGSAAAPNYTSIAHNDFILGAYLSGGYSNGYLSFGYTSDPLRKFHIGSANSATFDGSTGFVPAITVTSGGNLGIGTTAPTSRLHVSQTQADTSGIAPTATIVNNIQPASASAAYNQGLSVTSSYNSAAAHTGDMRTVATEMSIVGPGAVSNAYGVYTRLYDTVASHQTTNMYGIRGEVFSYGTGTSMYGGYNTGSAYNNATFSSVYGTYSTASSSSTASVSNSLYGSFNQASNSSTTSAAIPNIIGTRSGAYHTGSQTATAVYGVFGEAYASAANSTTGNLMAGYFQAIRSNNAPVTNTYGTYSYAGTSASDTSGTINNVFGAYTSGRHFGSNTVSNLYGSYNYATNIGSGTVSTLMGRYNYTENVATGTISSLLQGDFTLARTYHSSGNLPYVRGSRLIAQNYGTGTVGDLTGLLIESATYTNSNTTNTYGISVSTANTGGGTATNITGINIDLGSTSTTTNYYGLLVADEGTSNPNWYSIYTGSTKSRFGGDVAVVGTLTATDLVLTSDGRKKTAVRPLAGSLQSILLLRPVSYQWKAGSVEAKSDRGTRLGFMAQEFEKVFPALVHTAPDGSKSIGYIDLFAPLVSAIQELADRLSALLQRLEWLVTRVASVEVENQRLRRELAIERQTNDAQQARLERLEQVCIPIP